MAPAVFRNARLGFRVAQLEANIFELARAVDNLAKAQAFLRMVIETQMERLPGERPPGHSEPRPN
jgi:hypothetical protein